jgi:hypothetical protein
VRIENSATNGLDLQGNTGFDPASQNLVITGSKKSPMLIGGKAVGTIPTGTYTGNGQEWFLLDQLQTNIDADTTWKDRGVAVGISDGELGIRGRGGVATLTLEAGVTVKMLSSSQAPGGRIVVGDSTGDKVPTGALIAVGTANKPVTFQGRGNKNDWPGISFWGTVDPSSHLDHVVVEDVGAFDAQTGSECVEGLNAIMPADVGSGAIRFFLLEKNTALRTDFLQNSTIRRSGSNGILPDFHPTNGLDFCATNKFEDIAVCNQTPFRDGMYACPVAPVPCQCP